jgi:hypothetical protein
MSNPQTGRRKVKSSISLGTIIFWGFLGWVWFGDTISEFFDDITKTAAVVTVNGEKKVIDVDKIIDNAVQKAEAVLDSTKKEKEEKPEPHPDEGEIMTAAEDKKFDDRYGDYSNADKY